MVLVLFFFFSSRRRHTRCALVTGVQTCAPPIWCTNAIWCRATSTTWSRRVSRKSVSIATCWAIFCCVCRVSPKPKVAWSWRRSRKLCLLRLSSEIGGQASGGARKNHIVAVHQFGVSHRTQYLGNTVAGLGHDAASVGGRVIDEPVPRIHAR